MSKKISKYISLFDYSDKCLIVLSVTSDSASIASFATVTGAPIGKTSDHSDKCFIVLSVTSGSASIASFATVTGAPIGKTSAYLSLAFSLCTGLVKNY